MKTYREIREMKTAARLNTLERRIETLENLTHTQQDLLTTQHTTTQQDIARLTRHVLNQL